MKEVFILIGNYGSGKTEIALNMAAEASDKGLRALVIDLDRINDYFRMSDHIKLLEEKHVNVVTPTFAGRGITQSCLPGAVAAAFSGQWDRVIFDVGGDPAGARSLGRYYEDFMQLEPEVLQVYDIVNVFRPMSESPEKILKLKDDMESFSRLKITGFINNSNLQIYASSDDIRQGYEVLRQTSILSNLPIAYTTGKKDFLEEFLMDNKDKKFVGKALPLELYMQRNWNNFSYGRI